MNGGVCPLIDVLPSLDRWLAGFDRSPLEALERQKELHPALPCPLSCCGPLLVALDVLEDVYSTSCALFPRVWIIARTDLRKKDSGEGT